ncbi:MAG: hypothetical protein QOF76_1522 [Solirubrobacteraceae bacterium]|nr:hypothetical protein [Solirubrobacteraceae bacterium]
MIAVTPPHAFYAGPPVRVRIEIARPRDLAVELVRIANSRTVRRFTRTAAPAGTHVLRWNGLTAGGHVAGEGRYAVRVNDRRAAAFSFHRHRYPIDGPHADRGGIGYFGAPRSGGRIHEGFDVLSPCGTPVVAARGGTVLERVYDPVLYGNLLKIHVRRSHQVYWYAHLQGVSVAEGARVRTGQQLGTIGATGNARTVGCQLHFEERTHGVPMDPAPDLHRWDTWS